MKTIIAAACFMLLALPVLAATDQQKKAKACDAAAVKKGLKGDERKAYVRACVSAKAKTKPDAGAKPETKAARPATPATPAKPSAASPAASPSASNPNSATEKKRLKCEEMARQSNVSPSTKKTFMDKCTAG